MIFFCGIVFYAAAVPIALRGLLDSLDVEITREGLHNRFNKESAVFMKSCFEHILKEKVSNTAIDTELLNNFNKVYIIDSSVFNISDGLKGVLPGSGGNKTTSKAAIKIQFLYEYKSGEASFFELTEGKKPDSKYTAEVPDLIGMNDLFIPDLGYWKFETFQQIDEKGGYLLSRYHTTTNLWIKKDEGFSRLDIDEFLKSQPGKNKAVEIEAYIRKNNEYLKLRVVAYRVPEEIANKRRANLKKKAGKKSGKKKAHTPKKKNLYLCDWSIFVTNTNEKQISSEMIRSVYRIRWSIELIFKNWKSILKIHKSNVIKNENRLKVELYGKLIFAALTHKVYQLMAPLLWLEKNKELSMWCITDFFIRRTESMLNAIRISAKEFNRLINSFVPNIFKTCVKHYQLSRKTTLQMIDEFIGDDKPVKLQV